MTASLPSARSASSRTPFVVAAIIAGIAFAMVGSASTKPWSYLEYPRHVSILALLVALVAMFRRRPALAIATPFLVAGLAFAWQFVGEWRGLAKLGKTELIWSELDLLARLSILRLAPWLVGALAGALAGLAVTRTPNDKQNFVRAGAWLVVVAAVCLAITLANDGWVSHTSEGELHDFTAWPGPQRTAFGVAIATGVIGLAAIGYGSQRTTPPLPEARIHRG